MQNRPDRAGKPAGASAAPKAAPKPKRSQSALVRVLKRIGAAILVLLGLMLAYVFLLLGEPDDDAKQAPVTVEESILMPMNALDMPGETDVQKLADSFGQPVLYLQQSLAMYKARIYDTAFEGEYARCVTVTYTFEDGQQLLAQSIRPTAAVSLLKEQGYKLDASALYTMGGLNAARMQNDTHICVFAQSEHAVYAIVCPVSHAAELPELLRYTTLSEPVAAN